MRLERCGPNSAGTRNEIPKNELGNIHRIMFYLSYYLPNGRRRPPSLRFAVQVTARRTTTRHKLVINRLQYCGFAGEGTLGFRISMAEDHVLVLAPKSFASKLSKREGKIGVLNNDVSFDVDAGMNRTTSSGLCQSHECHHHVSLC